MSAVAEARRALRRGAGGGDALRLLAALAESGIAPANPAPGARRACHRATARALLGALALLAALVPAARAQRAAWSDAVYVPGQWTGGRLVAVRTQNGSTDTLALVMRVDYFAKAPRFRMEVRRSADGQTFGDAQVLLGNGADVQVVTALGATPLARHALNTDTLVRAAIAAAPGGRLAGVANGRVVERAADGTVGRVVFRRSQRSPVFDDAMLDPRNSSAGRQFLSRSIASVGDQRSTAVVATAGARGVDRVQTPNGSVPVTPDSLAIRRMEAFPIGAMTLEEFLRQGGLGPYAVRPDSGGGHQ
jgi:hypothetical protein